MEQEELLPLPEQPKEDEVPKQKHNFKLREDGEIDIFAYEAGDYHNGPICADCDYAFCHHCEPEGYGDQSCLYDQELTQYFKEKNEIGKLNHDIEVRNKLRQELNCAQEDLKNK